MNLNTERPWWNAGPGAAIQVFLDTVEQAIARASEKP